MPDRAWEDPFGIHYIKHVPEKPKPVDPGRCMQCGAPATCMPQLFVPCSAMAIVQIKPVSSLMSVILCDKHFFEAQKKPEQFFAEQHVRDDISRHFTRLGTYPNFAKAVVGRVPASDPDYQRLHEIMRKQRAGG